MAFFSSRDYDCRRLSLDLENFFIRTLNQRNLPERFEVGKRDTLMRRCIDAIIHAIESIYAQICWVVKKSGAKIEIEDAQTLCITQKIQIEIYTAEPAYSRLQGNREYCLLTEKYTVKEMEL